MTLITVSVTRKLFYSRFSFSKWLLCSTGLTRYLCPTNSELRSIANIPRINKKPRNRHRNNDDKNDEIETFNIPKNLDIELESTFVRIQDVSQLKYYQEYSWLIDFSVYSAFLYVLTEVILALSFARSETNLSMIWCLLVICFSVKQITKLTGEYFSSEAVGERSTIIVSAFFFLLLAMIVLIIDESILDTGLDKSYSEFYNRANLFLKLQGFNSQGPASKLILKLCMAIWCSYIGTVLVFPSFRLAKMHHDTLSYCSEKKLLLFALNLNFISPLIICLFWIKPICHDYLTNRILWEMPRPLFSVKSFEIFRIILVIVCMLSRLIVIPVYLQSYLNIAYQKATALKMEVGKITNIEFQKKVSSVFYYLCVVVLQCLIPLVMCLFFAFMYKTLASVIRLGEYSWSDITHQSVFSLDSSLFRNRSDCGAAMGRNMSIQNTMNIFDKPIKPKIAFNAEEFSELPKAIYFQQIFTKEIYRGLFGFSLWWTCFVWFLTSNVGFFYYMYFCTT